jgi:hypothetical protein
MENIIRVVKDVNSSGFDISEELDLCRITPNDDVGDIIEAISERIDDSSFQQDLIDFEILEKVLRGKFEILSVSKILFNDLKPLLNRVGIIDQIVDEFLLFQPGSSIYKLISKVCRGCTDNKVKFLRLKIDGMPLVQFLVSSKLKSVIDFDLLGVLLAVLAEDGKSNSPICVLEKESLLAESIIESTRAILRRYRIEAKKIDELNTVLLLVSELSISQVASRQFALEDDFLKWSFSSDASDKVILKYIRQISFGDDLKVPVLESLVNEGRKWLTDLIEKREHPGSIFGIFANLSIRNGVNVETILNSFPSIVELIRFVFYQERLFSNHVMTQCLLFVRNFSEFNVFRSDSLTLLKGTTTDKTIDRLCSEILEKCNV